MAVLALAGFTAGRMGLLPPIAAREAPSIMVLPFLNLGGDDACVRLAHGLTEDVITDLARFRNLDVIALDSSDDYKGEAGEMRRFARQLGARYALAGHRCSRRAARSASPRS